VPGDTQERRRERERGGKAATQRVLIEMMETTLFREERSEEECKTERDWGEED
jgi:hypothetical protein